MRNDKTLTKLEIGGIDRDRDSTFATFDINPDYEPHEGGIASSVSVNDMIKFGTFLGKNKYIKSLTVHRPTYKPRPHSSSEDDGSFDELTLEQLLEYEEALSLPPQFIEGLKRNSSITRLYLCNDNINNRDLADGKVGFEILKIYEEKGTLTELFVMVCVLPPSSLIANTIMSCTNLIEITLLHCSITDEQLLPLVDAIRHTSLEKLCLSTNAIQNVGCQAISTLLEDHRCTLNTLDLYNNAISNEGAVILYKSLENNTTLQELRLGSNPIRNTAEDVISAPGSMMDSLSRLLCNTSSLNSIHSSNHTLVTLSLPDPVPPNINDFLILNEDTNKKQVAIKKILQYKYHPDIIDMRPPDIDIEQLFEWDSEGEWSLKALPYVIAWFERATEAIVSVRDKEWLIIPINHTVSRQKLSAIYQFAQAMPLLFAAATPFVASPAKDEATVKSRVEMESMNRDSERVEKKSMNKVATENCCVIL